MLFELTFVCLLLCDVVSTIPVITSHDQVTSLNDLSSHMDSHCDLDSMLMNESPVSLSSECESSSTLSSDCETPLTSSDNSEWYTENLNMPDISETLTSNQLESTAVCELSSDKPDYEWDTFISFPDENSCSVVVDPAQSCSQVESRETHAVVESRKRPNSKHDSDKETMHKNKKYRTYNSDANLSEIEASNLNTKQQPSNDLPDSLNSSTNNATSFQELLTRATQNKCIESQFQLGLHYFQGDHPEIMKNPNEAFTWFEKAAERGHPLAQCYTGFLYELGQGINQNKRKAYSWYHKAASRGYVLGQYHVATCHEEGKGAKKDWNKALFWYQKAVAQGEQGHFALKKLLDLQWKMNAQNNLTKNTAVQLHPTFSLRDGTHVEATIMNAYENHSHSQFLMGLQRFRGDASAGISKNYSESLKWFQLAAQQNHGKACYYIGMCYEHGLGVIKNNVQAVLWYQKSAMLGDVQGQYRLASCFDLGILGVEKSRNRALYWYVKAAEQGQSLAWNRMACLHMNTQPSNS